MRDVVKEFMTESGVHRLSRFLLDTRTTYSTDLRTLRPGVDDVGIRWLIGRCQSRLNVAVVVGIEQAANENVT
jgi:hypothetical protein